MATTRERAQAAREAKLDELHKRLTGAVEHLVSGEDWSRALAFAAQFRARSFSNTLLIWDQHQGAYEQGRVPGPFPSYVAGYKQWQALGRQVEKGQPGYQILAPVTGRFASATPQDAESWRRLGKGEKPRAGEVVRSKMVGVRPAYVWDASQTSGDPIPEPPAPNLLEGEAPAGLWDGLSEQVEAAGFAVSGRKQPAAAIRPCRMMTAPSNEPRLSSKERMKKPRLPPMNEKTSGAQRSGWWPSITNLLLHIDRLRAQRQDILTS